MWNLDIIYFASFSLISKVRNLKLGDVFSLNSQLRDSDLPRHSEYLHITTSIFIIIKTMQMYQSSGTFSYREHFQKIELPEQGEHFTLE